VHRWLRAAPSSRPSVTLGRPGGHERRAQEPLGSRVACVPGGRTRSSVEPSYNGARASRRSRTSSQCSLALCAASSCKVDESKSAALVLALRQARCVDRRPVSRIKVSCGTLPFFFEAEFLAAGVETSCDLLGRSFFLLYIYTS
jgi:hypothetical protein